MEQGVSHTFHPAVGQEAAPWWHGPLPLLLSIHWHPEQVDLFHSQDRTQPYPLHHQVSDIVSRGRNTAVCQKLVVRKQLAEEREWAAFPSGLGPLKGGSALKAGGKLPAEAGHRCIRACEAEKKQNVLKISHVMACHPHTPTSKSDGPTQLMS